MTHEDMPILLKVFVRLTTVPIAGALGGLAAALTVAGLDNLTPRSPMTRIVATLALIVVGSLLMVVLNKKERPYRVMAWLLTSICRVRYAFATVGWLAGFLAFVVIGHELIPNAERAPGSITTSLTMAYVIGTTLPVVVWLALRRSRDKLENEAEAKKRGWLDIVEDDNSVPAENLLVEL